MYYDIYVQTKQKILNQIFITCTTITLLCNSNTNHSNVAVWVAMQTRIEAGVMVHFFGV